MLASTRVLKRLGPDGTAAVREIYSELVKTALTALVARIGGYFMSGLRGRDEVEGLARNTARAFSPEQKADDFLQRRVPPNLEIVTLATVEAWKRDEAARLTAERDPEYMAIKDMRLDPDAPPLDERDRSSLGVEPRLIDRDKTKLLDLWPQAYVDLVCLRLLAERIPNPDAAAQPPEQQTQGQQALAMPGGDVAIVHGAGAQDRDDDGKDDEKGGGNL